MFITFYFFDLGFKSDNGKITSLILNFINSKRMSKLKKKSLFGPNCGKYDNVNILHVLGERIVLMLILKVK